VNGDGWRCYSTVIEEETPVSFSGKLLIFISYSFILMSYEDISVSDLFIWDLNRNP
jgi:hypothetical protein